MIQLKLLWLDLVGGSLCHKIAIWKLAVMIFLSKAISKPRGLHYATLSMAKHIDHISRSAYFEIEELALFAISWRGKPLFSWCVPSFSVVWTIATVYSLTSLLIKCTAFKKSKIMQPKSFFRKSKHEHVTPLLKKLHWLPVKERILF